jgi:small subunit ribosomal protein S16
MLSIRFKRIGRKKMPIYRIVVMEKHKDPWANYKEKLGFYNPRTKETELKEDRIKYWLSVGAQASDTVHNLFVRNGLVEADKKKAVKISNKRTEKINEKKAAAEEKAKDTPAEEKPVETKEEEETAPVETKAPQEEKPTKDIPKEEVTPEVKKGKASVEEKKEEVREEKEPEETKTEEKSEKKKEEAK